LNQRRKKKKKLSYEKKAFYKEKVKIQSEKSQFGDFELHWIINVG
jgi:hypothetical protein